MSKKDTISKEYFKVPERFADICNGILFDGERVVEPYELSEVDIEYAYVNRQDKKSIVDIAKCWAKTDTTLALIVQENQTNTDYGMVLRNMLSESLMYSRQLSERTKEHRTKNDLRPGSEFVSGITKEDRFTPIITIVLYLGKEKWDGATTLFEMLDLYEDIKPFVINYKINLYDYNDYDSYENFKTDVALAFKALSTHKDKNKLTSLFSGDNKVIAPDVMRFIGTMLDMKNVESYIQKNKLGEEEGHMCKALEDLVEEGSDIKLINLIIKKVNKGKTIEVIADELEEEIESIQTIYDAVIANLGKSAKEIYNIMLGKQD